MKIEMKNWFSTFWPAIVIINLILFLILFAIFARLDQERNELKWAQDHITIVTTTDKNCNDCHLGESFVNLFNHEAVKSNDNVVRLMMDRAKIKQW